MTKLGMAVWEGMDPHGNRPIGPDQVEKLTDSGFFGTGKAYSQRQTATRRYQVRICMY